MCAAVAERYGLSRTVVRVGPQIVAYLLGWALFPKEPRTATRW